MAAGTLEPPEPESAPVSAPSDVGTPAPVERSGQVQEEAPGPLVAQQRTPGPRVARQETPGPRVARQETPGPRAARQKAPGPREARQRPPEAMPVYEEDLEGKDRQTKVAEPPGQMKTKTQLGVR